MFHCVCWITWSELMGPSWTNASVLLTDAPDWWFLHVHYKSRLSYITDDYFLMSTYSDRHWLSMNQGDLKFAGLDSQCWIICAVHCWNMIFKESTVTSFSKVGGFRCPCCSEELTEDTGDSSHTDVESSSCSQWLRLTRTLILQRDVALVWNG